MDIFISWHGAKSQFVAENLKLWLKMVLQNTNPWISSDDLPKGSRWNPELSSKLERVQSGIICLTSSNLNSNWIHFEAGAKSTSSNIWTLLLNLDHKNVEYPLAQFNHSNADNKKDFFKMIKAINNSMDTSLEKEILQKTFEKNWDEIETIFKKASTIEESKDEIERSPNDLLNEILSLARDNTSQINKVLQSINEFTYISTKLTNTGLVPPGLLSQALGTQSKSPPSNTPASK